MRRAAISSAVMILVAATVSAVTPARDVFIPSVGRLKGACTKGVCAQFRTNVWVYNAAAQGADVTVAFLKRDADNSTPAATHAFSVGPGPDRAIGLAGAAGNAFRLDRVAGAPTPRFRWKESFVAPHRSGGKAWRR